jgi:hypothetical protein
MNDLGFVETVDGFGESIVVAVADAAYRRLDTRFRQALGLFDRDLWADPVAVMHEPVAMHGPPVMQGLFQRIENEACTTDTKGGIFGMLSMLTSAAWLQFSPLSLMNRNKSASASNLGHLDVIRLQGDTGSGESGLSATYATRRLQQRRCKSVDRLWSNLCPRRTTDPRTR